MIKFGIVITTYMRPDGTTPKYLTRCLESVKNQTHKNYKVYVIGDKYENNSEFTDICNRIIDKDKIFFENLPFAKERDKYIPNNLEALWSYGGWYASNYGIDVALNDGIEYICRLDHDDFWAPNHLSNFNEAITKFNAQFVCSLSSYLHHRILPTIKPTTDKFVKYIPAPMGCIKSSTCLNQKTIPLRTRNLMEETGSVGLPGDADLWGRVNKHIINNNIPSYVVNEKTCFHDEEGSTRIIFSKKR
jgi:glycosyltransferase involved in cell wall biosynthesis